MNLFKNKKILILGGIIVLLVLGVVVWRIFFSNPNQSPVELEPGENLAASTSTATSSASSSSTQLFTLEKLSDQTQVFDYWVDKAQQPFYLGEDGIVYGAKSGPDPSLTVDAVSALNYTLLSPDQTWLLVGLGDPKTPEWRLFDTADQVWRPFSLSFVTAAWGGDDNSLFGVVRTNEERMLIEVNIEQMIQGVERPYTVLVRDFWIQDVSLSFYNNALYIIEKTSSLVSPRVWQLNTSTNALRLVYSAEQGSVISFSDHGEVFQFVPDKPFLILDAEFNELIPTFFKTLPSKCASSDAHIACFAPPTLTPLGVPNIVLPESYFQKVFLTQDNLFFVSKETQDIERIQLEALDKLTMDATNVRFVGESLYFINRYNQALYRIIPTQ